MKLVHALRLCVPSALTSCFRDAHTCQLAAGHAVSARFGLVAAEQDSRSQPASKGADVRQLPPRLQSEWIPDGSCHLDNTVSMLDSACKAWRSCSQCPGGDPHVWQVRVDLWIRHGTGCPPLSGSKVCKHNTLATKAPSALQYWHKEKIHPNLQTLSPQAAV